MLLAHRKLHDVTCSNIATSNGIKLPWVNELRFLGTYILKANSFKCSIHECKKSFFRSANAIFGKVGRIASENVVIHLIYSKCLPVLLYGLECFMLSKSQLNSLDFSFNRFLFKLFKTADINVVNFCRDMFNVKLPSELLALRRKRFTLKYNEYRGINRVNLA